MIAAVLIALGCLGVVLVLAGMDYATGPLRDGDSDWDGLS